MAWWLFTGDRRLSRTEVLDLRKERRCYGCDGFLLRLAEREPRYPYRWLPMGYICEACNHTYLEMGA